MAASLCSPPLRVIFLDVDGVLHPLGPNFLPCLAVPDELFARTDDELEHCEEEGFVFTVVAGEFVPPCMAQLKRIVDTTGATIVLSSTWRAEGYLVRAVDDELSKAGIQPIPVRTEAEAEAETGADNSSHCRSSSRLPEQLSARMLSATPKMGRHGCASTGERLREIHGWLGSAVYASSCGPVASYVILDDMDLMALNDQNESDAAANAVDGEDSGGGILTPGVRAALSDRFVRTDSSKGLTSQDADAAIRILRLDIDGI